MHVRGVDLRAYLEQVPAGLEILAEILLLLLLAQPFQSAGGKREKAEVGVDFEQSLPVLVVELIEPMRAVVYGRNHQNDAGGNKA